MSSAHRVPPVRVGRKDRRTKLRKVDYNVPSPFFEKTGDKIRSRTFSMMLFLGLTATVRLIYPGIQQT